MTIEGGGETPHASNKEVATMAGISVPMEQVKETKRTVRYEEVTVDGQEPAVGLIYVPKPTLESINANRTGSYPQRIRVTVEVD
jgi:hypothetical protein